MIVVLSVIYATREFISFSKMYNGGDDKKRNPNVVGFPNSLIVSNLSNASPDKS